MSTTDTNTIFGAFLTDIGSVLTTNLPLILGVFAALVGLGIVIYYFRRWVGHK